MLAAASAAAAASTTTALAFLRSVTFRTGMMKISYRVSNVHEIRRTWILTLPFVVFMLLHPALQQEECVAWLVLVELWVDDNIPEWYYFIPHGDSRSNTFMPGTRSFCLVD